VTVLFAFLALNVIPTVLLQLKIFPCDSSQARQTDKSYLRNISENETITFRTEKAAKQHFLKKCTTSSLPLTKIFKRS